MNSIRNSYFLVPSKDTIIQATSSTLKECIAGGKDEEKFIMPLDGSRPATATAAQKAALTYLYRGMFTSVSPQKRGGKNKKGKKGGKNKSKSSFDELDGVIPASGIVKTFTLMDPIPGVKIPKFVNKPFKTTMEYNTDFAIATNTVTETLGAYNFTLAAFNGYADYTAVFDQYRLYQVEVWVSPHQTADAATGSHHGMLCTVIDLDDSTTPASQAALMQYGNVVCSSGVQGHYRKWTPAISVAAYSGAFTSFAVEMAPWIDVASSGVQHYGLKFALNATSVVYTYSIMVRGHFEFRATR